MTTAPGQSALYTTPPTNDEPFMDVSEAARILGVGKSTIYQAIKEGTLEVVTEGGSRPMRYVRVGTRIRVSRLDVRQVAGRSV